MVYFNDVLLLKVDKPVSEAVKLGFHIGGSVAG
jgi:hypothetical protein